MAQLRFSFIAIYFFPALVISREIKISQRENVVFQHPHSSSRPGQIEKASSPASASPAAAADNIQDLKMPGLQLSVLLAVLAVLLCCSTVRVGAQITDPSEVSALGAIRSRLNDPLKHLGNWDKGDPCLSNWTGVWCFNSTLDDGYLHVRELYDFELWLDYSKFLQLLNMNLSGTLAPELGQLSYMEILDFMWNKMSGSIPREIGNIKSLRLLQVDNNNFSGTEIPPTYANMSKLLKLNRHIRVPGTAVCKDLSLTDVSYNKLNGSIPSNKLSDDITTIDLSNNNLIGPIPASFSDLPSLQILNFQNNQLSSVSGVVTPPANVTIMLEGNPVCSNANRFNISQFCGSQNGAGVTTEGYANRSTTCPPYACPVDDNFDYVPDSPEPCFCAAPLRVGYRLKSPGFSDFPPYKGLFEEYLTTGLKLDLYQLSIGSFIWEEGPRLRMYLKLFPLFGRNQTFNKTEILRIRNMFTGWNIPDSDVFGPYELLNFTLLGPYTNVLGGSSSSGISKGALAGIALGAVAVAVTISAIIALFIMRRQRKYYQTISRKRIYLPLTSRIPIKIDGVKGFTFEEMTLATNNFSDSTQVGQGGYGKVYRGILADGTVVAIKRAQEGSLQGQKEFFTEIELLSRVHHRNLVSLLGYCDEEGEQQHSQVSGPPDLRKTVKTHGQHGALLDGEFRCFRIAKTEEGLLKRGFGLYECLLADQDQDLLLLGGKHITSNEAAEEFTLAALCRQPLTISLRRRKLLLEALALMW
ncbi:hypothetical protein ACLOJK_031518 [Asimina triloba]